MAKDFSENFNSVEKEKEYTSQELIRGFARFPSIGAGENAKENEFTKHWLWHSLMLCQHYIHTERVLSKTRIRQILNLQVSSDNYEKQERGSYNWLKEAHQNHPEIKDLIEALLRFLETNAGEHNSKGSFKNKSLKDYMNFGGKTLYVMASAGVSALFLPNILVVGGIFLVLSATGLFVSNMRTKMKKSNFNKSVKKKIIEIDNMSPQTQSQEILSLISDQNYTSLQSYPELKVVFDKLVLATRRFAALHQKHDSKMEDFLNVKSIWANTMPSLARADLSSQEVREYTLSVMDKMLFMLDRNVNDLIRIELNILKIEDAYWDAKVSGEVADDIKA